MATVPASCPSPRLAALEHHAIAYAGEPLLWDAAQRQQLLRELVQLGAAVEAAFGGVPQVGAAGRSVCGWRAAAAQGKEMC